ncbi:glycoside hydrolase family 9 protein [Paenibacillus daejeonensis]|uniref:glycoside hydrolase family 9 protein n=1 Tax=Paenibacillus daejeonensis TaxID=135193 RepID=UPI00035EDDD4|nr:glycoside hydrolase family 9 protein [Paenibacillus daejeonensis]
MKTISNSGLPYVTMVLTVMLMLVMAGCSNDPSPPVPPPDNERVNETTDSDESEEIQVNENSVDERIKVNQVGYFPGAINRAMLAGEEGGERFRVVNLADGQVVYEGSLSQPVQDSDAGELVREMDFSELGQEGEYRIDVDGVGYSHPFRISSNVYEDVFAELTRSYTLGRSGVPMNDPVTGLQHPGGHLQDAHAELDPDFPEAGDGQPIDVSGGWYDAGDYGKYTSPAAITVAQLLLSYELYPQAYTKQNLQIPADIADPAAASWPDVLEEVKFELDWMLKMQRADGAVYHKLAGMQWPGMIRPEQDTQPRYIFGLSTYGTAMYAGALAIAARVYEPFDKAYAEQLLASSQAAQAYLEKQTNPLFIKTQRQDNGSGGYEKSGDWGERYWAAAELLKTTSDAHYASVLEDLLSQQSPAAAEAIGWGSGLSLGHFALATAAGAPEHRRATASSLLVDKAQAIVSRSDANGYRYALESDEYTWASAKKGMALAQLLLLAQELEPQDVFVSVALEQLHYTLGRNTLGTTYVTGAGAVMPMHPHHRIMVSTGVYVPGLVVGGPNRYGGDPAIDKLLQEQSPPPAKSYIDHVDSYSTNEYAIDYNAPLVFVLAALNR